MNEKAAPAFLGLDSYDTSPVAEEGAVMEVVGPGVDGEVLRWPVPPDAPEGTLGRPWTITFYGMDSKRLQALVRNQSDRRVAVAFRTRQPQAFSGTEADTIALLVAATKEWDIPLSDGTPAKNDPKGYRDAYSHPGYRWLYEQGVAFINAPANFLKSASKN